MVSAAGLDIIQAGEETAEESGDPVTFIWIAARKRQEAD